MSMLLIVTGTVVAEEPRKTDGYHGIWYELRQRSEYGDKYSGGLGTYTANHIPIAIHSPEQDKTFFVYGGSFPGQRRLLIMASYYDHKLNRVPRPTIVHEKKGVNDPHDNPSLLIDGEGYLWVYASGRGRRRPGLIFRSSEPWSVEAFEQIEEREFTYPQPRYFEGFGVFHLFTKYTAGRELYWSTSRDGRSWSEDQKLAGILGHYQVSGAHGTKVGTAFMYHPGGSVDRRTNLYYLETSDFGQTWSLADGTTVKPPLTEVKNDALLIEYEAQKKNVYIHDLNFDEAGRPAILYLTSGGHQPGPDNAPRTWFITRWTGSAWETHEVCKSTHNYDVGSLYITGQRWTVIGPSEVGPQRWGTGGEIAMWTSDDEGRTWGKQRDVTRNSEFNHTYVRRPINATDPFHAFWADGNPDEFSESRLYFGDSSGRVWRLPYNMSDDFATPEEVTVSD